MNQITRVANPIAGEIAAAPSPQSAMASTDQVRAIAETKAAMAIAQANPRNEMAASDRIINACQRPGLAEAAIYSYARGGSDIEGPSIRLAEAIAQNWGNLHFGLREIAQRQGESEVQAFAWDLETNVRREISFTVPHTRDTKSGPKALRDSRDIYEMVANMGQRRVRSCILAVIPGDIIEMAVEQCNITMRASADTSPEAIQKLVVAFQAFGVVQQQIEERIQRRLDTITPAQVVAMKKIYRSLRDGMSTPDQWFTPIEGDAGTDENKQKRAAKGNAGVKDALQRQKGKDQPAPDAQAEKNNEPAPPPHTETVAKDADSPADESASEEDSPATAFLKETRAGIEQATTKETVAAVEDKWLKNAVAYPDEVQTEIDGMLAAKRAELREHHEN